MLQLVRAAVLTAMAGWMDHGLAEALSRVTEGSWDTSPVRIVLPAATGQPERLFLLSLPST
eukprot:scaffold122670_cov30-Prasinocladus_malaysianus.AAC.1